jgi:deoxycytidylate deaminase
MLVPCLKQKIRCIIVRSTPLGAVEYAYEATNACDVSHGGVTECPRVTLGVLSGERYDVCGSIHAEARCADLARETMDLPGIAYVSGHTFICRECQEALVAVNVRKFVITGKPA